VVKTVSFEFATAARILFGPGVAREAPAAAGALGRRPLLVTGGSPDRAVSLGLNGVFFSVIGEPTVAIVREAVQKARTETCDLVIAIGGGSVLDAGKAIAAMLTNAGDLVDYLEVIGAGKPLSHPPAPFIAIPTTAGTGSEVTRNAVLGSPEHRVKASLRSISMLPRLAIVDPELTLTLPRAMTASTGLDALTQLIEPYVSTRANAMTDLLCAEGIRRAASALPRAWEAGADQEARTSMSWVAALGGMALANAGLGAVHGFAAPVGGMFPAPHGAVCAAILPHASAMNLRALRSRASDTESLRRYSEVARLLTGKSQATPEDGVAWLADLCRRFEIPPLRTYGVRAAHIPELVEKAARSNSMRGNPIQLTAEELSEVAAAAI
jgi:alcohol dehydrogenase class IV